MIASYSIVSQDEVKFSIWRLDVVSYGLKKFILKPWRR